MSTPSHVHPRAWLILSAALTASAACLVLFAPHRGTPEVIDDDEAPGSALPVTGRPAPDAIAATVARISYRPGERVMLRVLSAPPGLRMSVQRAGRGPQGTMRGSAVKTPIRVLSATRAVLTVGSWPSGLYYVRLSAPGGLHGYAPFVVRPGHLGLHRVAVVLPTNTWQAYNFFDGDDDGKPDSWYANEDASCVQLGRPFLDHGIPPHYRAYDRGFVGWLARMHERVDFLTDDDLERIDGGARLARAYDLIVFSGHEEYVTTHAYDVIDAFRDHGGNLMFLSANNFFYRVDRHGNLICRSGRWRDLGRPEAKLVGIQYVDWYQERYPNRPYVITGVEQVSWPFKGTHLRDGDQFGNYGIEIDATTSDSPRGIKVLAQIPDIFGPGKSAEMTYYTTRSGAKVFAAGVINFGGSALWPSVSPLLDNLWKELCKP